ncbi:MAG TPA: cation:proton antiporter [Holophagaceae bacterium]|nr:cation:proton antiporter [Holophagaceae bacterium]
MPPVLLVADPLAGTLALLALMWIAAKVGGEMAVRLKMPAVAGELLAGLAWATAVNAWPGAMPGIASDPSMDLLGNLGVIVLMFAVGLESTVPQMLKVGLASLRVALIGVALPMGLGLLGAALFLPKGTPLAVDLFIGACLCATSIGISSQVLKEAGALDSTEGRVIVGAAVMDDVLGLLVLVAVSGLAAAATSGSGLPLGALAKTLALALLFLGLALTLGRFATPHLFKLADRFRSEQLLLPLALGFAFLLAWLGNRAGLATIVGAYAAGLILEPAHIENLERKEHHSLEELVHPLVMVLAPLFFVLVGAKVDPLALLKPSTLLFGAALALLGTLGKWIAGLGAGRAMRWTAVGWGMVPRGEVGFIFVGVGDTLRVHGQPLLSPEVSAAILAALLLTTLIGPVGLGWDLRRAAKS